MEEKQNDLHMTEFSLSALTDELVQPFRALAKAQGKSFTSRIQPEIILRGDERTVSQVISNLSPGLQPGRKITAGFYRFSIADRGLSVYGGQK